MNKRPSGLVAFPALFLVGAGCVSGTSSDPGGTSQALGGGGGSSPGMSTTIEPQYGMTTFGGSGDCQSMACGISNSCSSQPWYAASSQRYGCNVHLQVTANGKCVVVQTEDAGPASWVETDAGTPILDSGPQVAQYLFGTSSLGWSDIKSNPGKYIVQVSTTSAPLGPCSATGDAGAGGDGAAASSGSGGSPGSGSGGGDGGMTGTGGKGGGGKGGGTGGGKGGSAGTGGGGGGSGKDAGSGYAFVEPRAADRHHSMDLEPGASRTIPFVWRDSSGLAPVADLWVEADGRSVLQIASVDGHPFVRSGLDAVALDPGVQYRIMIGRVGDTWNVTVLRPNDDVLLSTEAHAGGASAADVVLPGEPWRMSVLADL